MNSHNVQTVFFFILFAGVITVALLMVLPYLGALVIAAAFAVLFYPLNEKISAKMRFRGLAAFITSFLVFVLVLIPLTGIGFLIFNEAQQLYDFLSVGSAGGGLTVFISGIESLADRFSIPVKIDAYSYASEGLNWIASRFGNIFAGTARAVVNFFIGFIALYYLFKDGRKFAARLVSVVPLPDEQVSEIMKRLVATTNAVIKGSLVIAALQGFLTGVGFWLFAIPNPALWGSLAALTSLVPGIGAGLVIIPAVLYALFFNPLVYAIALIVWGVVVVGFSDNALRPFLMKKEIQVHPFFILISVIGGLGLFGPLGFILGPIVLSLLFALGSIYSRTVPA